jgi:hypothetical protein
VSEASVAWARESIDELSRTLVGLSLSPEPINVGARGAAIAVRTGGDYFVTLFAPVSEGPSTVVLSTGVFRSVDSSRSADALAAVNAYNRTRGGGRCVVTRSNSSSGDLLFSLHDTIGPAILTHVPPYFQALLTAFTPLSARKVLRAHGINGERWLWRSDADLQLLFGAVDDQADVLLDLQDLMNPER